MFISATIILGLAVVGFAVPPEQRARAQVITRCTVPNTAALTFVSFFLCFPLLYTHPNHLILLVQDDGPHLYTLVAFRAVLSNRPTID
jgi:hypothetical protein